MVNPAWAAVIAAEAAAFAAERAVAAAHLAGSSTSIISRDDRA